jgi:hypothetical protein
MKMNTEFKKVIRIFQRPDGLWPLEDGKLLTESELDKLISITDFRWILINNPSSKDATDKNNNDGATN